MDERIYYSKTTGSGKRTLTIYPLKLTSEQQEELIIMEKRMTELAETAEEEMSINLKSVGQEK
jgi:hypothetical protein